MHNRGGAAREGWSEPGTLRVGFDEAWEAIVRRDRRYGSAFLYAVRTTGAYCRPGCASRLPRRENVLLFANAEQAEAQGFRECKRCRPRGHPRNATAAALSRARALLEARAGQPIKLQELAAAVGMSPFHLQRTFKARFGVSPRDYADVVRAERLKAGLRAGERVTSALFGAGYGSASRAYERADAHLGMTPGAYRSGGAGMEIQFSTVPTSLGALLVAATERGICTVSLGDDPKELEERLRAEFPRAAIRPADETLDRWVAEVARYVEGEIDQLDLPLDVSGTAFQRRVWKELQAIPRGETRSYAEIAERIGRPTAVRAVGSAIARNRLAVIVPCHRVIRNDGALSGYRWGPERKRKLLEREAQAREKSESK